MVSVVIPAFNAEDFLEECLASVAAQSFSDFEVVVVDDGSTDRTFDIASSFAARDSRFRVVRRPNEGVSKARNVGIGLAKGDFLTFVDADDLLHPRAFESMLEALRASDAQVCITSFQSFDDPSKLRVGLPSSVPSRVWDYVSAMKVALYQKRKINSPWGVMLSRELLGADRRFREGIRYEDLDAFYRFYEGASRIVYLDFPFYFYRRNPKSFIQNWSPARLDVLDVTDRILAFMRERYPELEGAALDRRFAAHYNMLLLMKRHHVDNPEAMDRCRSVIREGRLRALRDGDVRLKNKLGALLSFFSL